MRSKFDFGTLKDLVSDKDTIARANDELVTFGYRLAKTTKINPRRPPYVTVGEGGTAMFRTPYGYYRAAGEWGVTDGFVNGKHVVVGWYEDDDHPEAKPTPSDFDGKELIPISRKQYLEEDDGGPDYYDE